MHSKKNLFIIKNIAIFYFLLLIMVNNVNAEEETPADLLNIYG
jgi:hypothetical protein